MRIGRHINEGFRNILRNKWLTVASLITVAITLFIVGVFTVVILNVNNMSNALKENVEIVVSVDTKVKESRIAGMEVEFKNIDKVDTVQFVSKKEGLDSLLKDLGESGAAFESLKKDNPLNDTYIVRTKIPEDTESVAKQISKIDGVESVNYGKEVVDALFKVTKGVQQIGAVLILGLALTALFLISNAVKVSIDSRRKELQIMRLVGATNNFIRAPYVFEGALIGLLGSILPLAIVAIGYTSLYNTYAHTLDIDFLQLVPTNEILIPLTATILLFSILMGALGSAFSITKHLKA